jgi:hypothetical protein
MNAQLPARSCGIFTFTSAFWFVFCVQVPCWAVPLPDNTNTPTAFYAVAQGAGQFCPSAGMVHTSCQQEHHQMEFATVSCCVLIVQCSRAFVRKTSLDVPPRSDQ